MMTLIKKVIKTFGYLDKVIFGDQVMELHKTITF